MSEEIAKVIQRQLVLLNKNRKWLADEARLSVSTLEKGMAGQRPFSFEALRKIERALDVVLEAPAPSTQLAAAPESLGAYTRPSVCWLEGRYLALRHSFQTESAVLAYALLLRWDEQQHALSFLQSDDFGGAITRRGVVSVSLRSGHSYLLGQEFGDHDLTVLGRPADGGRLSGICTTLHFRRGAPYPVSSAIVLIPQIVSADELPLCGLVRPGEPAHARYQLLLDAVQANGLAYFSGRVDP